MALKCVLPDSFTRTGDILQRVATPSWLAPATGFGGSSACGPLAQSGNSQRAANTDELVGSPLVTVSLGYVYF